MSIFLQLLRCFRCRKEDDHDYQTSNSHTNRFPESHSCYQLPPEPIFHRSDPPNSACVDPHSSYSSKLKQSTTSSSLKPSTSSCTLARSSSTARNSSNVINQRRKKSVKWVQKNSFPPPITEDIKDLIKKNIVSEVLNQREVSTSFSKPPKDSSESHRSSQKHPKSKPAPSPSSSKLPPVFKRVLSPASGKKNYGWVEKDSLPICAIPEDVKDMIKNDIVPKVLNQPLSPQTYKDYFAALLYAEEFYLEKWSDHHLENTVLELREEDVYNYRTQEKERKTFVAFAIDSVPEGRPLLLSKELVYVRPSDKDAQLF